MWKGISWNIIVVKMLKSHQQQFGQESTIQKRIYKKKKKQTKHKQQSEH